MRIAFADGTTWTQRLTPQQPSVIIPSTQSAAGVSAVYFELGVEHILTGADHLLFVLAMLIITQGLWRLVKTVTAFTVAHSITLGLAALGFVHVPQSPVEAVIALSIVFVAAEIVHGWQGREGIAAQAPWLIAFAFGLLHGFGFAGALSEIGLPQGHIPLALLFFNLGVEAGQLLFIGGILSVTALDTGAQDRLPTVACTRAAVRHRQRGDVLGHSKGRGILIAIMDQWRMKHMKLVPACIRCTSCARLVGSICRSRARPRTLARSTRQRRKRCIQPSRLTLLTQDEISQRARFLVTRTYTRLPRLTRVLSAHGSGHVKPFVSPVAKRSWRQAGSQQSSHGLWISWSLPTTRTTWASSRTS